MLNRNDPAFYAAEIFGQIIWDIAYFPLWWYSKGLLGLVRFLKDSLDDKEKSLGLSVWIKNIFRPMYGQRDLAGSLISFMMRLIQIFLRSLIMLFWLAAAVLAVCFWILSPFYAAYQLIFQIL